MKLSHFLNLIVVTSAATKKTQAKRQVTRGAMTFPRSRNMDAPNKCPFCADGTGVCGGGPRSHWDRSLQTDEAHGTFYVDPPTKILAGGLLEVAFAFENVAVGGGVVTLELCVRPQYPQLDESCFETLVRDPWDQRISPYLPQYPHLFFLPDRACMKTDPAIHARFQIPANVTTSHSIIRWQYQPPEICNPLPEDIETELSLWQSERTTANAVCHIPLTRLPSCGYDCPSKSCQGRVYKNCADVVMVTALSNNTELVYLSNYTRRSIRNRPADFRRDEYRPVVSVRNFEVEILEIAPEEDTDYCGKDFLDQVEACEKVIVDGPDTERYYCASKCDLLAKDSETAGYQWCVSNGVCNLVSCVATFYSDVCDVANSRV